MITEVYQTIILEDDTPQVEDEFEKMTTLEQGKIGLKLSSRLAIYVYEHRLGEVFDSQTTFRMIGMPPTRQPDVAFVIQARLPTNLRVTADFAPDLAVEIVSPNDALFEIEAKVLQYQQSDVKLIWVVRPFSQLVDVYRLETGLNPTTLNITNELDGEDGIPGFNLLITNIFN